MFKALPRPCNNCTAIVSDLPTNVMSALNVVPFGLKGLSKPHGWLSEGIGRFLMGIKLPSTRANSNVLHKR